MKKTLLTLVMTLIGWATVNAMSHSAIRENARFLSDRMAYELDLTPQQYDDCYEINYDFISAINPYMDDVCRGYTDAIERYYTYLDYRNDDLRYILTSHQYRTFLGLDYFYRPVYTYINKWIFRVYQVYNNRNFYYYDAPSIYRSYRGEHARNHHDKGFYGQNHRYSHSKYEKPVNIRGGKQQDSYRRNDFGVNHQQRGSVRPNDYKNSNQKDREKDQRYQNERKENKNSPQINQRDNQRNNQSDNQPRLGRR